MLEEEMPERKVRKKLRKSGRAHRPQCRSDSESRRERRKVKGKYLRLAQT